MKRPVPPPQSRRLEFPCWDRKLMKNVKDALSSVKEIARNCCRFVQLHPNCSGTTAFFLALYLICPFGFKFLTYSISVFYGVAVMIKAVANAEPRDAGEANRHASKNREFPPLKSDSADSGSIGRTYQKPKISSQMSKRRNFKIRIEDLETLDDSEIKLLSSPMLGMVKVHDLLGEREMKLEELSSWHLDADDSIDRNDKPGLEDGEMMLDSSIIARQGESLSQEKLAAGKDEQNLNGDELIPDLAPESGEANQSREGSRSHSEGDNGSEEDDRRQAVEWTDDDQQNLADLGLSEIERNKRLENLIAKRMAKKSMSMKHFEKFLDLHMGPISPVNISKNPLVPPHLAGTFLDLPGSAPSVFSPERNPFDLPYDPNEEKPNLMVDSFGAEILEPHPRDIISRRESFFYGSSFMPGFDKDPGHHENAPWFSVMEKWNAREPRHSRFRQKSDKDQHDWLVEHRISKGKDPNRLQNEGTANSIDDNLEDLPDELVIKQRQEDASAEEDSITESVSSTSEDQKEATEASNDLDFSFQGISPRLANVLSYENVSQATERTDGRIGHTSTFSIASDMQVEISGGSSPRNLADYTPDDAESSTHDDDKDRQAGFTDGEIWGAMSKRNDIVTLDLPEGVEDEEPSKENNCHNSNNMSYPFGSYISLIELDREEFHLLKQFKGAPSPGSSCDNGVEVRKSRFDDPSNESTSVSSASEAENYSVHSESDHTPSERDEEVNEENQ